MIEAIDNDEDYMASLDRINELMDAAPGTPEGAELDTLVTFVEQYEEYMHALDRINELMDAVPGTPDGAELDTLVGRYKRQPAPFSSHILHGQKGDFGRGERRSSAPRLGPIIEEGQEGV